MPQSNALYLTEDLRRIEHAALALLPQGTLMERAAEAIARHALDLLAPRADGARVLVLAGPGNNGGDALLATILLRQRGVAAEVMLCARREQRPPDAQRALDKACQAGIAFIDANPNTVGDGAWDLVLDGVFGIGLARPPEDEVRALFAQVNALSCPVLAIDVPSGLDADTGMPLGEENSAVVASHTVTFIAGKPGLHTGRGRDHAGKVRVDTLDIPAAQFPAARLHLAEVSMFIDALPSRPHYAHKGSFGDVSLVGGAQGMTGALILAARAALFTGAGRIFAGFVDRPPDYDSMHPELMCRHASALALTSGAAVVGPGLGMAEAGMQAFARVLESPLPAVIDADALNLLARDAAVQTQLQRRAAPSLLTPHPLEAARMLGCGTAEVQADRISAARGLARRCNAVVLLKGSGTVIAAPDGSAAINPTGNPLLATGGTGDVLAGVCGALLAQGVSTWHAAIAGAWLHGRAADDLASTGTGPVGVGASELIPAVRAALNRLPRRPGSTAGAPRQS
ncbi:MAG TPA: NAD(P)H-hydrate dehydratase [Noviherbaspirillum sp.]|jgi:hydroxyethylthiazole kinase-like uncharacterized protein yjeF|uniref:NAD(P)H-hydrate dehydratase n=1 Tax=Noviherbaspirillum sp. TaxID=1926288 RepID=UPI002F95417E